MKPVVLMTCSHSIQANLLKNKLQAVGITCFLHNENFSTMMPQYFNIFGNGVQVVVPEDQIEKAREIIQLNEGSIKCPNCSSEDIILEIERPKNKILVFFTLLFAGLVGNPLN